MDNQTKENIQETLAIQLENYVKIILKEYGDVINIEDIIRLKQIKDFKNEIIIWKTGTISCFVSKPDYKINFPEQVYNLLNKIKKIPGNGLLKKHLPYNKDNLIINDNTFVTYMKHIFIKGIDAKEFYEENLLHESLHFCGSGGSNPILEGLTEHRTRELAKKYNLKTTGCGYPKEVKIVDELQNILGEKFMNLYLFDTNKAWKYLEQEQGQEAKEFFKQVLNSMNSEFKHKYYGKTSEFNGLLAPLKKTLAYQQIDYNETHRLIKEYKEKLSKQQKAPTTSSTLISSNSKKNEKIINSQKKIHHETPNNYQKIKEYDKELHKYEEEPNNIGHKRR